MAKRRKDVKKIVVDDSKLSKDIKDLKPVCYGKKQSYCRQDVCGSHFTTCTYER